jgi:hypothetical protein
MQMTEEYVVEIELRAFFMPYVFCDWIFVLLLTLFVIQCDSWHSS